MVVGEVTEVATLVVREVTEVATLVVGRVTVVVTLAVDDVKPIICARLNNNVNYIVNIESWSLPYFIIAETKLI